MSTASPYTFHVVGRDEEPRHYELRDVSGRVVCKGFPWVDGCVSMFTGAIEDFTMDADIETVEKAMRDMRRRHDLFAMHAALHGVPTR